MPSGIYDRSDQSKWKPNPGRFKKGEHRSQDTEFKKGQSASPDTEFKIGVGNGFPHGHGKYNLPEYIEKQIKSHKGLDYTAQKHFKFSIDTRFKKGGHYSPTTEFCRGITGGENHPNWKGGITPLNTRERSKLEYIEWRLMVFSRDNFTCQKCGDNRGGNLVAHHIKSFARHPELRIDVNNGITLCRECHKEIHRKGKEVMNGESTCN